jgi:Ulp1 family protease
MTSAGVVVAWHICLHEPMLTWYGLHVCRSLLCYHRATNTLRHYDSLHSSNQRACRKVASRLSPIVQQPGQGQPTYVEVTQAPQQDNPDDCGPHALAVAQQLLAWAAAGRLDELEVLERELRCRLDAQHVQQLRTTMCDVISQLQAKASR